MDLKESGRVLPPAREFMVVVLVCALGAEVVVVLSLGAGRSEGVCRMDCYSREGLAKAKL